MTEITQELLKELLDYNPETGVLTWNKRDRKWFNKDHAMNVWNGKFSGKIAGQPFKRTKCEKTYNRISVLNKRYLSHRIIWLLVYGKWPLDQVDHIDGNGENNRIYNLRDVDQYENQKNCRFQSNNTSGCTGVHWSKRSNSWKVEIGSMGKSIFIGYFKDLINAIKARKEAEIKYSYHKNHGLERPL